jgi:hypothetical protein
MFSKSNERKTEKKKEKELGKSNQAEGRRFGLAREAAHGPFNSFSESVSRLPPPATDGRAPLVISARRPG